MFYHPDHVVDSPDGKILIADGLNPIKIWDGLQAAPVDAGLTAPLTAPTLAAAVGKGDIFGDYQAYYRELDADGNPSNLSPIATSLSARVGSVTITNAANTFPVRITATAHGLSTGHIVEIEGVQGNEAANGIWVVTVIDANNFDLDDSNGDGTYTSGGTVVAGTAQINYTNVPVPTSSKVVRKQILRNTDGQLTTFYVDVDTTAVATTSFSSTKNDDTLAAQEAVPLLNLDGQIFANANEQPPNFMTVGVHHLGRMFWLVNKVYRDGAVAVTNASTTVTGIATSWTAAMAGRFLYVLGSTRSYEIASVNVSAQTITLTEAYADSTAAYTTYAIRPAPAYRRQVWYSRAGRTQSYSATYALDLQDNGDELTGAMAKGSFIYFLERSHIQRLTFQTDPAVDGHVFPSGDRGCINNRCWVAVEDKTYMLDEKGVHAFDGESQAASTAIQPLFESGGEFASINWQAAERFHAVYSPQEEVVRWFVSLGSCTETRHVLVLNTRLDRWWIEEYTRSITSSVLGWRGQQRTIFLGAEGQKVFAVEGNLDGVNPETGTVVGQVTAASVCSLTDGHAFFPANLAGLSVAIIKGRGRGQQRTIHSSTATKLLLHIPWLILPDATSAYQIAGIRWSFRSKTFDWIEAQREVRRRLAVFFTPAASRAYFDIALFEDGRQVVMATTTDGEQYDGVGGTERFPRMLVDQTRPEGHAQQRIEGHRDLNFDGPRQVSFELSGIAGQDGFKSSQIVLDGAEG